jgi:hypothetical protein
MSGDFYTDAEVDELTVGLTQNAAKIRFLKRLGLRVDKKPNGAPLAWRPEPAGDQAQNAGAASAGDVVIGLQSWHRERKARGQKTQGR